MAPDAVSPAEQIKQEINHVKGDLNDLINKTNLPDIREEYSALDTTVANLVVRIQQIRDRKYAFNKIYEQLGRDYQNQWNSKKFTLQNQITTESANLRTTLRLIETRITILSPMTASILSVNALQNELDSFDLRITASEESLRDQYQDLKKEIEKLALKLTLIEGTLDNCDSASFAFLPGESVVMAVKAVWTRDSNEDKTDPEGILFLTDQRLLFEQKEEVATKKVLFITTERQLVQNLLFETPVVSIETLKGTKQGVFKNEDWLEFTLASGSFSREAKLHLNGQDGTEWQKLITRVKTGDINTDRAIELDKAAVEKARSAPEKCPNCGGAITKPVLRGMDSITCDFCGNVMRL
ncbi:MAG: hypothetical protein NTZ74_00255 [Chloroflexi bacterium]|nr:hypothetical protein [Chloroflexota bacterium]